MTSATDLIALAPKRYSLLIIAGSTNAVEVKEALSAGRKYFSMSTDEQLLDVNAIKEALARDGEVMSIP